MRKNMIVMIMMLDRRQKVHSCYKDISILKMSQSTKKSYYVLLPAVVVTLLPNYDTQGKKLMWRLNFAVFESH